MNYQLRKYSGKGMFGVDYIVGDVEDFEVSHQEGGSLSGQKFEVIDRLKNYQEFKNKYQELLQEFYRGDRIYKEETFSLYGCEPGGLIAGF